MKNTLLILFCLLGFLVIPSRAPAQGFEAPADSNAVVYFVRVTNYSNMTLYDFFHETKLIGKFNGANYMRYECPSGENLFWASSENKQFLKCDLKAGGTYLVLINITVGFWKSNLTLEPIVVQNEDFNRVLAFVHKNKALKMSQDKIDKIQAKLENRGFISSNLEKYEKKWINSNLTKIITPDMAIPERYLK